MTGVDKRNREVQAVGLPLRIRKVQGWTNLEFLPLSSTSTTMNLDPLTFVFAQTKANIKFLVTKGVITSSDADIIISKLSSSETAYSPQKTAQGQTSRAEFMPRGYSQTLPLTTQDSSSSTHTAHQDILFTAEAVWPWNENGQARFAPTSLDH